MTEKIEEDKTYEILKGELTRNLFGYVSQNLKDEDGLFIEDYNGKVLKILSVIEYIKKNPKAYEKAWIKWAKEKNKEIIKEKELAKKNKPIFIEDFLIITFKENGDVKTKKVDVEKITDYIISKYNFKTIFGSKSEEIYVYQDGIYTKNGREIIQTKTEKILGKYCSNHYISEIVEKIKRLSAISKEEFDEIPEELICLENGILNLKTGGLLKHNLKYYFKNKLPIKYDKKAKCQKIVKFFEEALYPEDIKVIQEWFGFCLYKRYFIKKAMIIFGGTDTGKTVLLNLLTSFLGKKNISGISLQRISSGDKFALVSLKDKYANVHDDLSSKDLVSGGFKEATGGGYISAEYKFGDTFQFLTFAKHIFATNQIPSLKEIELDDEAYYNRWMPIPLDNQIEEEKQDKFFIHKITTQEELSGLLNYALEGLKSLLKNGKFSFNKSFEEIKKIMERHGNPLSAFCQDVLVQKDGNKISKNIMFEIYSWYVNNKGFARLSKEQLGRRLEKFVPYILAKHSGKERYWENVDINPNLDKDTLDTFIKIYSRNSKGDSHYIDKVFSKASKTPKDGKPLLPKFSKEDIEKSGLDPKLIEETVKKVEEGENKEKKYKDYGEVDFEDHEIEQAEERYDKINKELEENS